MAAQLLHVSATVLWKEGRKEGSSLRRNKFTRNWVRRTACMYSRVLRSKNSSILAHCGTFIGDWWLAGVWGCCFLITACGRKPQKLSITGVPVALRCRLPLLYDGGSWMDMVLFVLVGGQYGSFYSPESIYFVCSPVCFSCFSLPPDSAASALLRGKDSRRTRRPGVRRPAGKKLGPASPRTRLGRDGTSA